MLSIGDLRTVLQRSVSAGVDRIMVTAGCLSDINEAADLIRYYGSCGVKLSTTVGVHPTRCMELEADPTMFQKLKESLTTHSSIISAIGEFGLDYDRLEFCSKDFQMRWFERQFDLLDACTKPLFLHMRGAADDFERIVKANRHRFTHGVVHSFTDTTEVVERMLSMGLFIGINGCSLRTAEALEVVKRIPLDRIMIESDAPWCNLRKSHAGYALIETHFSALDKAKHSPEHMVKSRNEPCCTLQVLEAIAALHQIEIEEAAHIIYENTIKIFPQTP